jgi:type IV secretion system protein TrbE
MGTFSQHLQWFGFAAPGAVSLVNGGLSRTYRYRGHDIASMDRADRVAFAERIAMAFKRLGTRWCTHAEAQHVEITGYPSAQWPTPASALLDREREAMCRKAGAQFATEQYLTLTQAPPPAGRSRLGALLLNDTVDLSEAVRTHQLDDFQRATDDFVAVLRGTLPLLEPLTDDETLTYYHSTISPHRHRVRASSMPTHISELLPDERFVPGAHLSLLGDQYIALCAVSGGFPVSDVPNIFDELNKLPFEFRWVSRWVSQDRSDSKSMLQNREKTHAGGSVGLRGAFKLAWSKSEPTQVDREAKKRAEAAGRAVELLSERGYGNIMTVFVLMDRDKDEVLRKRRELATVVRHQDFVVRDITLDGWKMWLGSLPGHATHGVRSSVVNTRNWADQMPSSTTYTGKQYDAPLAKLTGVKRPHLFTTDGTPFGFTSDGDGNAAHVFLGGGTRGGKSFLANTLTTQWLGYPGAQVVTMEIGRSGLGAAMANAGNIYELGDPASPLSFQPLAYVDEPDEARAAAEWLHLCYELQGHKVTPQQSEAIDDTLRELASDPQRRRTLTQYSHSVGSRDSALRDAIRPYTSATGAHYGRIFDGDNAATLQRARWTTFELGKLIKMRDEVVIPAFAHLIQRVKRWFDGSPTFFAIDEFGTLLEHHYFERIVNEALATWLKLDVRVLLSTQRMEQFTDKPKLLANVMSACKTQIYAPDASALRKKTLEVYQSTCGLNHVELQRIARMRLGEYYVRSEGGSRLFPLRPGPIGRCFAGMSSPEELVLLDRIRAQHPPAQWAAEMLRVKGLDRAAKEMQRWTKTSTGAAA